MKKMIVAAILLLAIVYEAKADDYTLAGCRADLVDILTTRELPTDLPDDLKLVECRVLVAFHYNMWLRDLKRK